MFAHFEDDLPKSIRGCRQSAMTGVFEEVSFQSLSLTQQIVGLFVHLHRQKLPFVSSIKGYCSSLNYVFALRRLNLADL